MKPMVLPVIDDSDASAGGPPESLRIAVIGTRGVPSNYSGVERIVEDLFEFIAAAGHRVTIYCRPGVLDGPSDSHKGMRLVRAPAPGGKNLETLSHSFFSTLHALGRGDRQDAGHQFDVISYHTIAPGLFTPLPRLAGIPVIHHVHGLDWQREKWRGLGSRVLRSCERAMVRNATQIVGVNFDIVEHYRARYGLNVPLLPNGVHRVSDHFTPDPDVLASFGLRPREYVVTISRLVPEKRIHDTIAAFAQAPGNIKLALVGEGRHSSEYVQRLREQARGDPRVVFTGLQGGHALETLFRSACLYVSASELEGLPSSLLECMERRVPAIVSDIAPHRQLMGSVAGYDWFFPVGDVAALARLIRTGLADEPKRSQLADGARQAVRANYSWPSLASATLKLYREVAEQARARRA